MGHETPEQKTWLEDPQAWKMEEGGDLIFFVINIWPMTELQGCYEQGILWMFHTDCKYLDVGYL